MKQRLFVAVLALFGLVAILPEPAMAQKHRDPDPIRRNQRSVRTIIDNSHEQYLRDQEELWCGYYGECGNYTRGNRYNGYSRGYGGRNRNNLGVEIVRGATRIGVEIIRSRRQANVVIVDQEPRGDHESPTRM
ncbi:MAG: hypothetical protein KW806_02575, partial [Candidatus Yanofskybacteria bacterium]|nr:hypothetical protein [Candidatus Yanofskybacteria bacterium]